jgi:glycosyltransferase involved in cell wall biosynthesis
VTVDVAIVHLGRAQARGEVRRVASWRATLECAGLTVADVPLRRRTVPEPRAVPGVLAGTAAAESLAWSVADLRRELARLVPRAVVVVSARAYSPEVGAGARPTVLDLVDPLDRAYRDRAALVGGVRGVGYRTLAHTHERLHQRLPLGADVVVAAGHDDALALGATWFPITVEAGGAPHDPDPDHDLVFTGTLSYAPNVGALQRLARVWPRLVARRPGASLLVAGATPGAAVEALCRSNGWTLAPNFADLAAVLGRARVAVAPLDHAAGIQIKVLDAAALGVPQVVTPPAVRGFAPGLGVPVAADDDAFVDLVVAALEDPERARADALALRTRVLDDYGVECWASTARALVGR